MQKHDTRERLLISLEAAVPLYVQELRKLHPHTRAARARRYAREAVEATAPRSRERGALARAFSQLARGIAALSLQPGGIVVFGRNYCGRHHPYGVDQPTDRQFCAACVAAPDEATAERIEGMEPRPRAVEALTRLGEAL